MSDTEMDELTIADDVVVTKYKMAGDMANRILVKVCNACVAGASVRQICEMGDKLILEETSSVYKKEKEMTKGIGFPTCISVNNTVCHFSPTAVDPDVTLAADDLVKIDLGVHIDGFIAGVGHTLVVGASADNKVTGKKADAILAAYYAAEAALRCFIEGEDKESRTNLSVTEKINEISEIYKCKPIEGMLSHQLLQNIIDGEKTIIQNPNDAQKKDHKKCTFETHEVYCLDVLVSSGDGTAKDSEANKTSVFKRTDNVYNLKLKSSRQFYHDVQSRFTMMPFTLRDFPDQKTARLAVKECVDHELLDPYPVLIEKDGEFVAQFKYTILLMPKGPLRITQGPTDLSNFESQYSLDDKNKAIITKPLQKSTKNKKKKAAAAQAQKDIKQESTVEDS